MAQQHEQDTDAWLQASAATVASMVQAMATIAAEDAEGAHVTADMLLLAFLRAHGYGAIAEAYEAVVTRFHGFWYA